MKILNNSINKIYRDEFGRIFGILVLDKPAGITSHDLVDEVRRKLKIRRVGHAGALDPFATGIMILLVGKATKLSSKFSNLDKEYEFEVLLGISTDTQDTEGKILKVKSSPKIEKGEIKELISKLKGTYRQSAPIFSSIRSDGIRLRELAHSSTKIERFKKNTDNYAKLTIDKSKPIFQNLLRSKKINEQGEITVKLPKRPVEILKVTVKGIKSIMGKDLKIQNKDIKPRDEFFLLKLLMQVSKGTYIRQLAEDIGERLGGLPAMLYSLDRTKIGQMGQKDVISLDKLKIASS